MHHNLLVNTEIYKEFNISDQHIELAIFQVKIKCTPQGTSLCLQRMRETLLAVADGNKLVVIGDMNIDYQHETTKSVKQIKRIEREFNLTYQILYKSCCQY